VVEDNSFTVDNEDEISFDYMACTAIQEVYLTEVSYESTKYTDSDGSYTTVYLYRTNYTDGEYIPYSDDYDENSQKVRADNTDVVDYLKNGLEIIYPKEAEGEITLKSKVSETAGKIYRPLTYKLVVVGDPEHGGGLRYTVTIKQYPSQYIEFGNAGNVFVNGYYARVQPDDGDLNNLPSGYMTNTFSGDGYYRSIGFSSSLYDSSNGYYWSGYGIDTFLDAPDYSTHGCINSGYGHIRGNVMDTLGVSLRKTVDIHVTAFSSSDNSFTTNTKKNTTYYIIGNPCVDGGFDNVTHKSLGTEVTHNDNDLYEYMTKGRKGVFYYRYVTSWGTNAALIKAGGDTKSFDPIIAPDFKMQSGYGMAHYTFSSFYDARKRCATYQEAGYPGGRWRLPTLAEIAFIIRLQDDEVVKGMFISGEKYWTSSGGVITADADMNYTPDAKNISGTEAYVRCVYDLWYWGNGIETPTSKFHAKPY
jgi:hypothetical protein